MRPRGWRICKPAFANARSAPVVRARDLVRGCLISSSKSTPDAARVRRVLPTRRPRRARRLGIRSNKKLCRTRAARSAGMSGEIEDANSWWNQGCLHPRSHLTCNAGRCNLRPALECVRKRLESKISVSSVSSVLKRQAKRGVTVHRAFTALSFSINGANAVHGQLFNNGRTR